MFIKAIQLLLCVAIISTSQVSACVHFDWSFNKASNDPENYVTLFSEVRGTLNDTLEFPSNPEKQIFCTVLQPPAHGPVVDTSVEDTVLGFGWMCNQGPDGYYPSGVWKRGLGKESKYTIELSDFNMNERVTVKYTRPPDVPGTQEFTASLAAMYDTSSSNSIVAHYTASWWC